GSIRGGTGVLPLFGPVRGAVRSLFRLYPCSRSDPCCRSSGATRLAVLRAWRRYRRCDLHRLCPVRRPRLRAGRYRADARHRRGGHGRRDLLLAFCRPLGRRGAPAGRYFEWVVRIFSAKAENTPANNQSIMRVTRGLLFMAAANLSAARTIGAVTGIDSTTNMAPRKNSLAGACGSWTDTNWGRKVMKKRMTFGLSRLTPSPVSQARFSDMFGPVFFSGEKAEPLVTA